MRGARNPITASTRLLPGQRSQVERGGDGVRDQPRIGQLGELDQRGARLDTPARRLGRARGRAASCPCRPYRKE